MPKANTIQKTKKSKIFILTSYALASLECPLCANSGHSVIHSITSSARPNGGVQLHNRGSTQDDGRIFWFM